MQVSASQCARDPSKKTKKCCRGENTVWEGVTSLQPIGTRIPAHLGELNTAQGGLNHLGYVSSFIWIPSDFFSFVICEIIVLSQRVLMKNQNDLESTKYVVRLR